MHSSQATNLTNCDREPIHIPGSIQPHGALLACDVGLQRILRHSANAASFLGLGRQSLIGEELDDVIGRKAAHDLRNALTKTLDPSRAGQLAGVAVGESGGAFDVSVHRYKGVAIVEFEAPGRDTPAALEIARALISRVRELDDTDALIRQTARLLRGLLEYDRVMIYQFAPDGSGRVAAEAKRGDLESFLGQHFPASDIPQQARQLYVRNTIRIIGDAGCEVVPLVPLRDASGEPLDLSFAHLRSVSPIHCEYLRNMGVVASMSISIIIGGELWGLIACHHYSPRSLTMGRRVAAELFGEFFSLQLDTLRQRERIATAATSRRVLDNFLLEIAVEDNVHNVLRENLPSLARLVSCDGAGIWVDGEWSAHGITPPPAAIPALTTFIGKVSDGKVWATHQLSARHPDAEAYHKDVSGLIAIPLTQAPRDYLLFFRREILQTVDWAGDPNKSYAAGPLGDRLTPRKSFAIWKENVERQALPWTEGDREIAEAARIALLEVILRHSETLSEERRKADVRQKILHEELNHRVKNILALIKSLVSQPVQAAQSLTSYVDALKQRIMALSHAHDQIVRNDGGGALAALLDAELSPYRAGGNIVLDGEPVALDARAFSVMTLVFHELATNAAKYGSLSVAGGRLSVTWKLSPGGDLDIVWRENDGPAVSQPKRRGFGTVLIDRSVPFDLGGRSDLDYAIGGVVATLTVPARFVTRIAREGALPGTAAVSPAPATGTLAGLRIMVLEDQLVIAMDVENMLAARGAADVLTYATAAEALRGLERQLPDVAVLDVNLGSETSLPVAEELTRRGVPFAFATGYGEGSMIPPALSAVPLVRKPYDAGALVAAISAARSSIR